MKMSGSAGVRDNDDDLSSGSFKHSQDLRLGLEPGFVAEGWVGGAKFDNPIAVGVEVPFLGPALRARAPLRLTG